MEHRGRKLSSWKTVEVRAPPRIRRNLRKPGRTGRDTTPRTTRLAAPHIVLRGTALNTTCRYADDVEASRQPGPAKQDSEMTKNDRSLIYRTIPIRTIALYAEARGRAQAHRQMLLDALCASRAMSTTAWRCAAPARSGCGSDAMNINARTAWPASQPASLSSLVLRPLPGLPVRVLIVDMSTLQPDHRSSDPDQ